jgi:hypothetical protein
MKTAPSGRPAEPAPATVGAQPIQAIVQDEYGTAPRRHSGSRRSPGPRSKTASWPPAWSPLTAGSSGPRRASAGTKLTGDGQQRHRTTGNRREGRQ